MNRFAITGTDTDVGKTVFAAGLAQALKAHYWKPVQAGLEGETDSQKVARLAPDATVVEEMYRLNTPCSPHAAADIDGTMICDTDLHLPTAEGPLVVEGAGGFFVPLHTDILYSEIMQRWDLPVIIVARTTLGTINHTLLTLEAVHAADLEVAATVFVGDAEPVAEKAIMDFGFADPHLGRLPFLDPLNAETLAAAFAEHINLSVLDD
ncbi:dethiobiotin synthase [Aurantiacibacter sp. MUD61]|uniref:dethiobiotin synthase n=1 Tax=Aurantiacibacter sp. MUD61 TaxID=3009083 RepID=UPI0022F01B46|nr:dethiobiotin synthase [Aurantiacibacter sp. MUD61]